MAELGNAVGQHRDTILLVLDLLRHTDDQCGHACLLLADGTSSRHREPSDSQEPVLPLRAANCLLLATAGSRTRCATSCSTMSPATLGVTDAHAPSAWSARTPGTRLDATPRRLGI